jgi:hypothetical protein
MILHKGDGCTGGNQASEPDESRTLIRNLHIGLETNVSLNMRGKNQIKLLNHRNKGFSYFTSNKLLKEGRWEFSGIDVILGGNQNQGLSHSISILDTALHINKYLKCGRIAIFGSLRLFERHMSPLSLPQTC